MLTDLARRIDGEEAVRRFVDACQTRTRGRLNSSIPLGLARVLTSAAALLRVEP